MRTTPASLQHWRLAIPVATLITLVFKSWDHTTLSSWANQHYWILRMGVFMGSGALGALVFYLLSQRGVPTTFKHPRGRIWAVLVVAFVLYEVVRYPVLVHLGVVDVGCAFPVTTGPEYLTVVFAGPLAEEVVYRALPLSFAMSLGRPGWTIATLLATTAIFALSHTHLELDDMVNVAIFGLFCGLLFLKTGKLWHIVLVHSLANTLVQLGEWTWHAVGYPLCP